MKKNKINNHRLTNFFHTLALLGGMLLLLGFVGRSLAGTSGLLWASVLGAYFSAPCCLALAMADCASSAVLCFRATSHFYNPLIRVINLSTTLRFTGGGRLIRDGAGVETPGLGAGTASAPSGRTNSTRPACNIPYTIRRI